ncbi:hypothetical protein HDU67_007811 [Dinochytrium kinnereticum]|nr:hypothetical protein HDU67_007811 [Dinochytrium kinnereticum]
MIFSAFVAAAAVLSQLASGVNAAPAALVHSSLADALYSDSTAFLLIHYQEKRSNYPPGYVVQVDCKRIDAVEVCALNKGLGSPRVKVIYHSAGYLWDQASPLSAYVKVNNADGTFGPFTADPSPGAPSSASYSVGEFSGVTYCYRGTVSEDPDYVPTFSGGYRRCPVTDLFPLLPGGVGEGSFRWFYNPAPAAENALVSQAGQWNVQVAVVNAKGSWDSLSGYNYRFTF